MSAERIALWIGFISLILICWFLFDWVNDPTVR